MDILTSLCPVKRHKERLLVVHNKFTKTNQSSDHASRVLTELHPLFSNTKKANDVVEDLTWISHAWRRLYAVWIINAHLRPLYLMATNTEIIGTVVVLSEGWSAARKRTDRPFARDAFFLERVRALFYMSDWEARGVIRIMADVTLTWLRHGLSFEIMM
jgi:hypothetical protein